MKLLLSSGVLETARMEVTTLRLPIVSSGLVRATVGVGLVWRGMAVGGTSRWLAVVVPWWSRPALLVDVDGPLNP
jgi:hypothetical protein